MLTIDCATPWTNELVAVRAELEACRRHTGQLRDSVLLCLDCRHTYLPQLLTLRWGLPSACPGCTSTRYVFFNQKAIAFMAEWLTEYLVASGGAQLEIRIKAAAERIGYTFEIVKWLANELEFWNGSDRWRLPDEHPLREEAAPTTT